ncbi:hypothetical protein [Actinokineospora sp.]|uniref:hypothetical protein n=1 Tax=Actinokineospora sp. TaxID=1872133 RepID=UPI004037F5DA
MTTTEKSAVMEPLRTWTVEGEVPITLSVYRPAVTIRCGDGPETVIDPKQVGLLAEHFVSVEDFFDTGDPDAF